MGRKCLCQKVQFAAALPEGAENYPKMNQDACGCQQTITPNGVRISNCVYIKLKEKLDKESQVC